MDIKRPLTIKIRSALQKERFAVPAANLTLGFLLSRTVLLGVFAPFGVAFAASVRGRRNRTLAFVGAFIGYLSRSGDFRVGKYIAALAIVYCVAAIASKTFAIPEKTYAFCSALLSTGFLALIEVSAGASESAFNIFAELVLTALSVYVFLNAMSERIYSGKTTVCKFCMLSAALLSLPNITLWGVTFSPGKIALMLLVMLSSRKSGVYGGTVTGMISGFLADISAGAIPVYAATFGCAGLLGGSQNKKAPAIFSAFFVLSVMLCSLCLNAKGAFLPVTIEALAAAALFLAFGKKTTFLSQAPLITEGARDAQGIRIKNYIRSRLSGMAAAYEDLAQAVEADENSEPAAPENPADIYALSYSKLCKNCKFSTDCWGKANRAQTKEAFSKAAERILKRGHVLREDFPPFFADNCRYFEAFLAYIDQSVATLRAASIRKAEKKESRRILSEQYGQIADILDGSAEKLGSDLHFDTETERHIRRRIKSWGIECSVLCYRDKNGLMRVEICGRNLSPLCGMTAELTAALSELTGLSFSGPEQMMGKSVHALSFKEECGYTCVIGAAAEKRDKNSISGDCGTYFYGEDGKLNIILCDGMGSGAEAAKESKRTLKLVESFLRAGVEPKHAVKIINSAVLCSNDCASFTTLDITVINPHNCLLTAVKCGAVQSFIRRERPKGVVGVLEIGAKKSAGFNIQSLLSPVCSQIQLKAGDMVILLSDGVCAGEEESAKIKEYIAKIHTQDPREMAELILKLSGKNAVEDDRSVIAISYLPIPKPSESEKGKVRLLK